MHEWEQQLNHAGQRPIRSLSLFLSLLSPSASSRLYTTARLPSTSHQAYTSTKSLARPNGFYNGRKRMGEATKRSNWTTTCNVCRRSSLGRLLALHLPRVRSNECSPLPLFPVHIAVFIYPSTTEKDHFCQKNRTQTIPENIWFPILHLLFPYLFLPWKKRKVNRDSSKNYINVLKMKRIFLIEENNWKNYVCNFFFLFFRLIFWR